MSTHFTSTKQHEKVYFTITYELGGVFGTLSAQRNDLVALDPNLSRGILAVNSSLAGLRNYELKIFKRNAPPTPPTFIEKIELWRENYLAIPDYVFNTFPQVYELELAALDHSGAIIDTELIPVALDPQNDPLDEYRIWDCESNRTSFRITEFIDGGTIHYSVSRAPNKYMYFGEEELPRSFYGHNGIFNTPTSVDNISGIVGEGHQGIQNHGDLVYRRDDGTYVNPSPDSYVVAVPKTKIDWCGHSTLFGSRPNAATLNADEAAFYISNDSDWPCDELLCVEMFDFGWSTVSDGETETVDYLWYWYLLSQTIAIKNDKIEDLLGTGSFDEDNDGDTDFWDYYHRTILKFGQDNGLDWSTSNLSYLTISKVGESSFPTITLNEQHFNANGSGVQIPSFNFSEGLYACTFIFEGHKPYEIYFPVKAPIANTFALSSLLEATPFPVPFAGNTFNIRFQSLASMSFSLQILDLNGRPVFSNQYIVRKDHDAVHQIVFEQGIQPGLYVIRLTFSDGSFKNILISKS